MSNPILSDDTHGLIREIEAIGEKMDTIIDLLQKGGPSPGPNPQPQPGEGLLITDHFRATVELGGVPTSVEWELDVLAGDVRGLHGLLGMNLAAWHAWSNYSANGKLYLEQQAASTPKADRVGFRWADWHRLKLVAEQGGKVALYVDGVHELALEGAALPRNDSSVEVYFGSTLAQEHSTPNHKANVGWRIRNGVVRALVGGQLREEVVTL